MVATNRGRLLALFLAAVAVAASSCGEDPVVPPPDADVATIDVSAPVAALDAVGRTVQLSTVARDASGNQVSASVTWASSDVSVLTVSASGEATAVSDGDATVTASIGGVEGDAQLSVLQVATGLAFVDQPAEADAGQRIDPVEVAWVDALGTPVVRRVDPIALSLAEDVSANYELIGGEARAAESGVATFTDLAIEGPGGAVRLRATAADFDETGADLTVREIVAPFDDFQAADLVIGQSDFSSGERSLGATRLQGPGGVTRIGEDGPFYVADLLGSRILGYEAIPTVSGKGAEFVLGQADFDSEDADSTLSAETFGYPASIATDGQKLVVSDVANNRVLIWNDAPHPGRRSADVVVGQPNFTSSTEGTSRTTLWQPSGVSVAGGRLVVVDAFNNRVLIWNTIPTANGAPADIVLGQLDFSTAFLGRSGASGFNSPWGVWSDGERLVVADEGNDRVLIWEEFPVSNGEPADLVIGVDDFDAGPPPGVPAADRNRLNCPRGVTSDGEFLYVADTGFNRVMIYPFPTRSGVSPIGVLGQSDFTLGASDDPNQDGQSDGVASARTFTAPSFVDLIDGSLFVSDLTNARVLRFTPVR